MILKRVYWVCSQARILMFSTSKIPMVRLSPVVLHSYECCSTANSNLLPPLWPAEYFFSSIFACRKNQQVFRPASPTDWTHPAVWPMFLHRYREWSWRCRWQFPRRPSSSFRLSDWWWCSHFYPCWSPSQLSTFKLQFIKL